MYNIFLCHFFNNIHLAELLHSLAAYLKTHINLAMSKKHLHTFKFHSNLLCVFTRIYTNLYIHISIYVFTYILFILSLFSYIWLWEIKNKRKKISGPFKCHKFSDNVFFLLIFLFVFLTPYIFFIHILSQHVRLKLENKQS